MATDFVLAQPVAQVTRALALTFRPSPLALAPTLALVLGLALALALTQALVLALAPALAIAQALA